MIDVFKKWMTFYFEDFTEENAIFFNMFLSDLSTCSPALSLSRSLPSRHSPADVLSRCRTRAGSKGFEAHADDLRSVFRVQGEAYRKRLAQEEVDAEKERAALAASEDITHRVPDLEDDDHDPADIARQMTLIEERVCTLKPPTARYVCTAPHHSTHLTTRLWLAALQGDLAQRVPAAGMEQKGWQGEGFVQTDPSCVARLGPKILTDTKTHARTHKPQPKS